VILAKGEEIQPEDLPPEIAAGTTPGPTPVAGSLEGMERQHIVSTLRQVGGHRGKAAALLEIDPKTLYRKILTYAIRPEEWK
jgi:two-component system response regulator HydG